MAITKIRLATASPGTQATTKETVAQIHQIASRAAAKGADILLLPEAYLGGYPRGLDFGCKIGSRTAEGREDYLRYFKGAVDLGDTVGDGAGAGEAWVKRQLGAEARDGRASTPVSRGDGTREEIERIARETGVFIVVGLVEKAGGSLYCSVIYVCPNLGAIGKRRKVQPTGTERLIWAQGSPATLKAISTTIRGVRINLAAAICWENYMPLLRQSLYAQNVNLYLAPTADARDAWLPLMRTVALEGRCFVVSSNMCVREAQKPQAQQNGTAANGIHEVERPKDPAGRRSSCLTEDGFEIALPVSPSNATRPRLASKGASRQRRSSVLDEDGNEIALPNGEHTTSTSAIVEEEDEEDAPKKHAVVPVRSHKEDTFLSRGGSSIISPTGDVIAGPQWEDEDGIIYADADFDDCIRGRLDLDAAGSYSRNDSFKFSVAGLDLDPLPYY
ncbi:carbon-nitrogen hydrolase [Hypoxylon rubiginosum]|uniref:Carbon-nitrogen hydrolase n=1 Tax=Hypoxylon rubiginosum TaxID=110542 RepID=A0ACC0CVA2_9PEZI|nr:carbon-nitrogen hydrolase [Hypoxylon rubiginosum]